VTTHSSVEDVRDDDHVRGSEDAAITIIQYGDYACPHTRAAEPILERLLRENTDVRLVFRHFPLRHLHPSAERVHRVAEAAEGQGKFWLAHEEFMRSGGALADESGLASHLNVERLQADADEEGVAARVDHAVKAGRAAGVHSTPTFFFNGALHDGHYDYETLSEQLSAARERLG
jgi:protein-disulfide isomerase